MSHITMREMLEAGVHFGHQTKRWDPRMKPYIFGARNGIYIIDLQQTVPLFNKAYDFLLNLTARGEKILFVGTKRQASELISTYATEAEQFFINHRWLGGCLTNYQTMRKSIQRLKKYEEMSTDGTFEKLTKKEVLGIQRERAKLLRNLGGVQNMSKLPGALFVIDINKEHLAVEEARKLGIPVVAVVDTNCNPDSITYPVPGNDDAIRTIRLFVSKAAQACREGAAIHAKQLQQQKEQSAQEKKTKAAAGNNQTTAEPTNGGPKVEVLTPPSKTPVETPVETPTAAEVTAEPASNATPAVK